MKRWAWGALLIGYLLATAIYLFALTPRIGGADDAHYIGLAQAIAEGKGFIRPLVPGNPPESQFPPGWPLMLSLVWLVTPEFPSNAIIFKFVSVACAFIFAGMSYRWLRGNGTSERTSTAIALLTLFHPFVLGYGTSAFSEMAYAASSMIALYMVERYAREKDATFTDAIIPALSVAWCMYIRTFGIVLIIAAVIYLTTIKRQQLLVFVGLVLVSIAPWFIRNAFLPPDLWGYSQQFWLKSMEQPDLGVIGWGDLVLRVILNLRAYLMAGLPSAILPSQVPLASVNMDDALRLGSPLPGLDIALAIVVSASMLGPMLLRRSLVDWYAALYLGLALLWPWEPLRFIVPLIPIVYSYVFSFVELFAQPLLVRFRSATRLVHLSGIAIVFLFLVLNVVRQATYSWSVHNSQPPADWSASVRLFEWIRTNTRPNSVLTSMNHFQLYLYTQRPVIYFLGTSDDLARYNIEYVVLVPYGGVLVEGDLSQMRFDALKRAYPDAFEIVYRDTPAMISVLRVNSEKIK